MCFSARIRTYGAVVIDQTSVLEQIQTLVRRGGYGIAGDYADGLSDDLRSQPAIGLARVRARMLQGQILAAENARSEIDLDKASPGERLIILLETSLTIMRRYGSLGAAFKFAQDACGQVLQVQSEIDPVLLAEAEWVLIRIQVSMASSYFIPLQEGKDAYNRLPEIASILEQGGRTDIALKARRLYTLRHYDNVNLYLKALADFAELAQAADRLDLAGEAYVNRAERLLIANRKTKAIVNSLKTAETLYAQINHLHGPIDVAVVRAKLAIERELDTTNQLDACISAYHEFDYFAGIDDVLRYLHNHSNERGNVSHAIKYCNQRLDLTDITGDELQKYHIWMSLVQLAIPTNQYTYAIELSESALSNDLPPYLAGNFLISLAVAHTALEEPDVALQFARKAVEFDAKLAESDFPSLTAATLAQALVNLGNDEALVEAEDLVTTWTQRDVKQRNYKAATQKMKLLADINIKRCRHSEIPNDKKKFIDRAKQALHDADRVGRKLLGTERKLLSANIKKRWIEIYDVLEDITQIEKTYRALQDVYVTLGLEEEVARCRLELGDYQFKYLKKDFTEHRFIEAETNLKAAGDYYYKAGMRQPLVFTSCSLADLYLWFVSVLSLVSPEHDTSDVMTELIDGATVHLDLAEAVSDAIRREYVSRSALEEQSGKRGLTKFSQPIYTLGLRLHVLHRRDVATAWSWVQRAKARALADSMGGVLPAHIVMALKDQPQSFGLIVQEREVSALINQAQPNERIGLRKRLADLHQAMAEDPHLTEYLELRTGIAVAQDDISDILTDDNDNVSSGLCVDWITIDDQLWLFCIRRNEQPEMVRLNLTLSEVQTFIKRNLNESALRPTLRDDPELLQTMGALIAPLADLSAQDELLILSPHAALHALPLHAMEIGNEPLFVRNPIVYCPSLSILRHCRVRRTVSRQDRLAALFGDPTGDRGSAAELVNHLGILFDTKPLLNGDVDRARFIDNVRDRSVIHFQGHAIHDQKDPLNSHLVLADGRLTARDVIELTDLNAELVTLAACESAANVIEPGDEPLGLIPAFLYAGANSVLAALWRVHQDSANVLMRNLYEIMLDSTQTVDKAQALRKAMLDLRATPGFDSPYHWAPYVLHGNWQ
jgi:CHAT domain-containing protein